MTAASDDSFFRRARTVAEIARLARAHLPTPLTRDTVIAIEVNRQRRLVVTTASGERYEVELRRECERIFNTLTPSLGARLLMMRVGEPLVLRSVSRSSGETAIDFRRPGRE